MENEQKNIALDSGLESVLNYAVRCALKDDGQKTQVANYLADRLQLLSDNALWAILNSLEDSNIEDNGVVAAQESPWDVLRSKARKEQKERIEAQERETYTIVAAECEQDGADDNLVILGGDDDNIFCRVLQSGLMDMQSHKFVPIMCMIIDKYADRYGQKETEIAEDILGLEIEKLQKKKQNNHLDNKK